MIGRSVLSAAACLLVCSCTFAHAQDDATAKTEAQVIFDALAVEISLTNFALWDDAGRLVCETVRKDAR